jgi:hypothetical protein
LSQSLKVVSSKAKTDAQVPAHQASDHSFYLVLLSPQQPTPHPKFPFSFMKSVNKDKGKVHYPKNS